MKIEFSKRAVKFIQKINSSQKKRIRAKIQLLKDSLEERQALPFDELDIKKLKGNWQGFFRIRVGQSRIIFTVSIEKDRIYIYDICFRGDAYN